MRAELLPRIGADLPSPALQAHALNGPPAVSLRDRPRSKRTVKEEAARAFPLLSFIVHRRLAHQAFELRCLGFWPENVRAHLRART
jgi:hypothetical protein